MRRAAIRRAIRRADAAHPASAYDCIPTIAEAVASYNTGGTTTSAAGVDINSNATSGIAAALALGRAADTIVLALGIDKTVETEGTDRADTALPGEQQAFATQVLALGKPTVLVLVNGGALAIDALVARAARADGGRAVRNRRGVQPERRRHAAARRHALREGEPLPASCR